MQIVIRNIGNSKGVVIPKIMLVQAPLDEASVAAVAVEGGSIVLRKPAKPVREGWAQAAKTITASGDDALVMGEFSNADDKDLQW